ncbi:hypothetical protein D893_02136 [Thioalkalivibrio sp. ALE21]|nr:hypothetical protein D893_02136 [Thioalkalivibrio sp. ALE21]
MSEQQAGQQSQTVAEALVAAVRRSARYNPDVESAPHCILWTDREQQWQSVIPALQGDMPELLVLGEYVPVGPGPFGRIRRCSIPWSAHSRSNGWRPVGSRSSVAAKRSVNSLPLSVTTCVTWNGARSISFFRKPRAASAVFERRTSR